MSESNGVIAVTGAFSYAGKYIARRLLADGERVRTLTRRPDRPNPFGQSIEVAPLDFENPAELARNLSGVTTLYNTYWVRFPRDGMTFERAVENTKTLIGVAKAAGVRRLVHLSVTNASTASPLDYYRGKGEIEAAIAGSGLSYGIIRPTLVFGVEDILINNIAWLLRRFPYFPIPGDGRYRVQPVSAEDVASIAVDAAEQTVDIVKDAAGPEVYTYDEFVRILAGAVGSRALIAHLDPNLVMLLARPVNILVRDVVLTLQEMEGLMQECLISHDAPTGGMRFSDWLVAHAAELGAHYASERKRHW